MQEKSNRANWGKLFSDALTCPGKVSEAYSVFHDYSLGNAILAAMQLTVRGLPLSPIASFNKWKKLGRCVKKGENAIALVMPVTVKTKSADEVENGAEGRFHERWLRLGRTERVLLERAEQLGMVSNGVSLTELARSVGERRSIVERRLGTALALVMPSGGGFE